MFFSSSLFVHANSFFQIYVDADDGAIVHAIQSKYSIFFFAFVLSAMLEIALLAHSTEVKEE